MFFLWGLVNWSHTFWFLWLAALKTFSIWLTVAIIMKGFVFFYKLFHKIISSQLKTKLELNNNNEQNLKRSSPDLHSLRSALKNKWVKKWRAGETFYLLIKTFRIYQSTTSHLMADWPSVSSHLIMSLARTTWLFFPNKYLHQKHTFEIFCQLVSIEIHAWSIERFRSRTCTVLGQPTWQWIHSSIWETAKHSRKASNIYLHWSMTFDITLLYFSFAVFSSSSCWLFSLSNRLTCEFVFWIIE